MDTDPSLLAGLLLRAYGLAGARLRPAPRGFAGETHWAELPDGRVLLLKLAPDRAGYAPADTALGALATLHQLGITGVSRPLPLLSGGWSVRLAGKTLMVFERAAGTPGTVHDWSLSPASLSYDAGRLGGLLARIHAATPHLPPGLPREDFTLPFMANYQRLLARITAGLKRTPAHAAACALLQPYAARMEHGRRELLTLAERCRRTPWRPCLTQGDTLGDNVLVADNGGLTLIDWDAALIAPAERDTWFYLNHPATMAAFLAGYQHVTPGYAPAADTHCYYLLRRFFEDLTDYLRIADGDSSPARQQWAVAEAEAVCFGWLWPAIRRIGTV